MNSGGKLNIDHRGELFPLLMETEVFDSLPERLFEKGGWAVAREDVGVWIKYD